MLIMFHEGRHKPPSIKASRILPPRSDDYRRESGCCLQSFTVTMRPVSIVRGNFHPRVGSSRTVSQPCEHGRPELRGVLSLWKRCGAEPSSTPPACPSGGLKTLPTRRSGIKGKNNAKSSATDLLVRIRPCSGPCPGLNGHVPRCAERFGSGGLLRPRWNQLYGRLRRPLPRLRPSQSMDLRSKPPRLKCLRD